MKVITRLIIGLEPNDSRLAKAIKNLGSMVHEVSKVGPDGKAAVTVWTDSLEEQAKIMRRLRAVLKTEVMALTTQYFSG